MTPSAPGPPWPRVLSGSLLRSRVASVAGRISLRGSTTKRPSGLARWSEAVRRPVDQQYDPRSERRGVDELQGRLNGLAFQQSSTLTEDGGIHEEPELVHQAGFDELPDDA